MPPVTEEPDVTAVSPTQSRAAAKASMMRVENLRVAYGNNPPVLRDINMAFPAGQVTAIIGPSGCGKTTLLTTLNRLAELNRNCHVQGRVMLDDVNVLAMDPILLRRRVGMVFQKP